MQGVHPAKLTWNTIMDLWFRCFSFSIGWFLGFLCLIFRGVLPKWQDGMVQLFGRCLLEILVVSFDAYPIKKLFHGCALNIYPIARNDFFHLFQQPETKGNQFLLDGDLFFGTILEVKCDLKSRLYWWLNGIECASSSSPFASST